MKAAIKPPAIETQNALIEPSYAVPIAPLLELVAAGDAPGSERVEVIVPMLEESEGSTETVTPAVVVKDVAVLVLCTAVLETEETIDVEVDVGSGIGVLDSDAVVVVVSLSEEEDVEVTRSVEVTDEAGSVVKDVSTSVDTATEVTVTTAGLVLWSS